MIAFFTHDLFPGRERLMPWRTIIEVCTVLQNTYNQNVIIYSLDSMPKNNIRTIESINIYSVNKQCYQDSDFFNKNNISHIFFPIVWRTSYKAIISLQSFTGKKTAYFPGGYYSKTQTLKAIKYIGFKVAIPYLLEAFIPKKRIVRFLQSVNFNDVIALSELTKNKIIEAGFLEKEIKLIMPGKDILPEKEGKSLISIEEKSFKKDKYYLFMGAPAKIRGLELLLKSFDKAFKKNTELKLICFLRTDPGSDNTYINSIIEKLKSKSNITIIWQEVSKEVLFSFVANSRAVILPFILIPSEIPLTYFEVLSLGTTIVSAENGGTTDYLSDSIFVSNGNVNSLSSKLLEVWSDDIAVRKKKSASKIKMDNHPTWMEVGKKWAKLL